MNKKLGSSINDLIGRTALFSVILSFGAFLVCLVVMSISEFDRKKDQIETLVRLYVNDFVSIEYGRRNTVYVEDSLRQLKTAINADQLWITDLETKVQASTEADLNPPELDRLSVLIQIPILEHSSRETIGILNVKLGLLQILGSLLVYVYSVSGILFVFTIWISSYVSRRLIKAILTPINTLSLWGKATGSTEDWPLELQELDRSLRVQQSQRDLAVVGMVTGGVIHDLKNYLHGIKVAEELVQETEAGSSDRLVMFENLAKVVRTQVDKMIDIIERTMDSIKDIKPELQEVDVKSLVLESYESIRSTAQERIVFQVNDEGRSLKAKVDPMMISRSVSNILKNSFESIQYDSNKDQKKVTVHLSQDPDFTRIRISDSGIGISEFEKDQLFTRIHSTKKHGTGLGLIVSQRMIHAHRGRILISKSKELGGAEFTIELPNSDRGAS